MAKGFLAVVLVLALIAGAVYVTGLGEGLVNMAGNAVKEMVGSRLAGAEKVAAKQLGNQIGDDKLKINLTNPLTGDKIEYTCEKGAK